MGLKSFLGIKPKQPRPIIIHVNQPPALVGGGLVRFGGRSIH